MIRRRLLERRVRQDYPAVLSVKREHLKPSSSIRDGVDAPKECFLAGGRHWAPRRRGIVIVAACASLLIGDAWPQASPSSEYAVKSAFLFHFALFAEWPPSAFKNASAPLTFCTLGEHEFRGTLDESISGKTIGNRPLRVQHLKELQDATGPGYFRGRGR